MNLHIIVTGGWYKNVIEWMTVNEKHEFVYLKKYCLPYSLIRSISRTLFEI